LSRNGRKGVCPGIFKKPFKELGLLVRILTDFFARCSKKKTADPTENFGFSGTERL
jgi:hypothetical protein